jgi:hypothetical protein
MQIKYELWRLFALTLVVALALSLWFSYGRGDLEGGYVILIVGQAALLVACLCVLMRPRPQAEFPFPLAMTIFGICVLDAVCRPEYFLVDGPVLGLPLWALSGAVVGAVVFHCCGWHARGGGIVGFFVQLLFTACRPVVTS